MRRLLLIVSVYYVCRIYITRLLPIRLCMDDDYDPIDDTPRDDNPAKGDDDDDETFPGSPQSSSTPAGGESIPMSERSSGSSSRGTRYAETSFIEPDTESEKMKKALKVTRANEDVKYYFPDYQLRSIDIFVGDDGQFYAKSRTGKRDIQVFLKKDPTKLTAEFKKAFGKVLGETREIKLAKLENEKTRLENSTSDKSLLLNPKIAELDEKINTIENMRAPSQQVGIPPPPSITFQEFEIADLSRIERESELIEDIQIQNEVLNDANSTEVQKEVARDKKLDDERQLTEVENEREEQMEGLSLGDKLRAKVREIFKKYGFTVTAVLLAVGTTLGVILSSLSNGLKSVARGVGNGLKNLGKRIAAILPGLLGSIVGFVFRTAGEVISFLGKNAWLLIVGVAVFLFEQYQKRNSR